VRVSCDRTELDTKCLDNDDGTYKVLWFSKMGGAYNLRVSIDGVDIVGSPTPVLMLAAKPDVSRFAVSGEGLQKAVAGKPAYVKVRCKDAFGNLCSLSKTSIKWGMQLLPLAENEYNQGAGGGIKSKRDKGKGEIAGDPSAAARNSHGAATLDSLTDSMGFVGRWVDEEYEMRFEAKKAGRFALHVWCVPQGSTNRELLPGSPFEVMVSEGDANATGSLIQKMEPEQLRDKSTAFIGAGTEVIFRPQLRDQFGNNASASDDALTATVTRQGPMQQPMKLPVKRLAGLGAYEVAYAPEQTGNYVAHMLLHGVDINDSPVHFTVKPAAPVGAKTKLIPPKHPFVIQSMASIILMAFDRYGNKLTESAKLTAPINARAQGNAASAPSVMDNNDGTYTITFTQNAVGDCKVMARMENVDLTPITVSFKAKPVDGGEVPNKEVPSKQGQQRKNAVEELEAQPPSSAPVVAAAEPAKQEPAAPTAAEAKEVKKGADKKKADKARVPERVLRRDGAEEVEEVEFEVDEE
jgi:hypothetical protein